MENLSRLITVLNNCRIACDHCSTASLQENHQEHLINCIKNTLSCASVCQTMTKLLQLHIPLEKQALDLCVQMCLTCAKECEKHKHEHCQLCAKICSECAEACQAFRANN